MKSYFARTFYSLDSKQYRVLFAGTVFSFLGMQMQVIARGFLAYDLTGKNSALGGVMLAFGLPQLILGLWGGVLADRLQKRRLLVVTHALVAVNSLWLAVMIELGMVEYWMLLAAGVVQGAGFAFIGPARQAFISDLVGKEAIGNAVVLQQLSMNSTRVIGPSLAGAFIAISFIGVGGVYMVTTLGFIIAAVTMLRLPPGMPRANAADRSPLADMRDGLSYVRHRPGIALLISISFAVVMIGFPYQSFLPSIAKSQFQVASSGLGLLSSVGAVGAVGATIVVATYASHPRAFFYQPFLGIGFGLAVVGLGLAPNFPAGLLMMVLVGGLASAFQSLNNALTMSLCDSEYTGRVQSISMLSWSLFGLVALPLGMLADAIGLRETLVIMGAGCVLSVAVLELVGRALGASEDRRPRIAGVDLDPVEAGGGGS